MALWICDVCDTINTEDIRCEWCWNRGFLFSPPPTRPRPTHRKYRTTSLIGDLDVKAKVLKKWQNGNCLVTLYENGSKTREWEGEPRPEFPETVDLKITDWCDAGCGYCHESSTTKGFHAAASTIAFLTSGLPEGVEIALGGGDPLSHPDLLPILIDMSKKGLVVNVTVNALHIKQHKQYIKDLRDMQLIYGLGISYQPKLPLEGIVDDKTVIHMIAGVHRMKELNNLPKSWPILVLGYKHYGMGTKYALQNNVKDCLAEWKYWIGRALSERNISFDSLALEQLSVRTWLNDEVWKTCFMGEDGKFSMYVNAPDHTYGVSSTSHRRNLRMRTIAGAFKELQDWRDAKVINLKPIGVGNPVQQENKPTGECTALVHVPKGEDSEGGPIMD